MTRPPVRQVPMFDVGFAEIFLLSVIGLLVLGPERLPAVARTLGGFMRKARTSWYTLKRSIETELAAADATEPLRSAGKEINEGLKDLSRSISDPEASPPPSADESNGDQAAG